MNEVLKALYDACMETQAITKTKMDIKQYKADLQCAYDCGYSAGKALLDKIRAEITNIHLTDTDGHSNNWYRDPQEIINDTLRIIDMHKAESEGEE